MSKSKSTTNFRHNVKPVNQWDRAIADAENIIEQSESKIKQMRRAIRAFEQMRDSGEPWPGTKDSEQCQIVVNDAVKQDARKARVAEQH